MYYIQKEVEVQAFRLTRDVIASAPPWFDKEIKEERAVIDESIVDGCLRIYGVTIRTPQGRMNAKIGDYIIREPDGSLCVRKAEKFKKLYAEVK